MSFNEILSALVPIAGFVVGLALGAIILKNKH